MEEPKVGAVVCILDSHALGVAKEVDHEFFSARVALHQGGEVWVHLDDLEAVEQWRSRRLAYEGEEK
jgi:hypothetical protein